MLNRGLIEKIVRETWTGTLLFAAGLCAVEAILARILPNFQRGLSAQLLQLPFIRIVLQAILGADVGDSVGATALSAMLWVHPVVLAITWAHAIVHCTRVPAAEIERGTIDVLLGMPVSRGQVFVCEAAVWLLSGGAVIAAGLAGNVLGSPADGLRLPADRLVAITANMYCMYVAVGGVAWLGSALSERRGRALGAAFSVVLASFLLNFLAQIWAPVRQLAFLGILNYYRPFFVQGASGWPVADMAVLLGLGAAAWVAALAVFRRRDIRTV